MAVGLHRPEDGYDRKLSSTSTDIIKNLENDGRVRGETNSVRPSSHCTL